MAELLRPDEPGVDADALTSVLERGGVWPHGAIDTVRFERIGLDYGLSGRTYRGHVTTGRGFSGTVVVKVEASEKLAKAVAFRRRNEVLMARLIPAALGWDLDVGNDEAFIVLEDVNPAVQGDDLVGCSRTQALSVIPILGRLHAHTWLEPTAAKARILLERWATPAWEPGRWSMRLANARTRYPAELDDDAVDRLASFDVETTEAIGQLMDGPASWIHHDPHLDNVLWRDNGAAVLLDWSGAVVAPPALDLGMLLIAMAFRREPAIPPDELIAIYAAELARVGCAADPDAISRKAVLALRPVIRGMLGWAGLATDERVEGRALALRESSVRRCLRAIRWIDDAA